ncbi:hypothetical protein GHT06_009861 [Daphnia sinensis]|uniref:MULE transposase domain-containing protein n=1 Tax=Daphnia sinensis TaxID=1820382 RepID=A0AAD5KXH0_9CRUS|nr:hypothetical protein GHT06_009861 [Daphnia sinensis]
MQDPMKQLFSINGFIKNDTGDLKQVPLLFCCMTRRRAVDYIAVFEKLKEIIPLPRVQRIVTDFERTIFVAVRKLFGNCTHQGCNFHWCQALLKKIRDLKLSSAYNKKGPNPIRDFVFRLLCLAYLPAEKIPTVFDGLRDSAPQELARLLEYMDENWIRGRFWTPENWSSFNLLLRTNNNCEGLHNEWKIDEKKIKAHRKKETSTKNSILFTLWSRYQATELSTNQLLEEIVLELRSSFPSVVSDHPMNINDDNIDAYDMSLDDKLVLRTVFLPVSDNIQLQHQKAVYNYFQTLLDSEPRGYTLWKELEKRIPKGVFRRLRLRPEPFPEQRPSKVDRRRPTPYARPVPETLHTGPLLNSEEREQLDALTRVRACHAVKIEEAKKAALEAQKMARLILEASQIRKEKERLKIREEALAKASRGNSPPRDPLPSTSKSPRRPTFLDRINREIKEQTIPKPVPVEVRSTASTPRKRFSRIISEDKLTKLTANCVQNTWANF